MRFLIILLSFIVDDAKKQLPATPEHPSAFQLVKRLTLTHPDGFYSSVDASISSNGKIVLIDRGNNKIHVYDKFGKHLLSFGKEGNGPGEIIGYESVVCLNKSIVLIRPYYLMFFDYSGNLLLDKKMDDLAIGYHSLKIDNQLVLQFPVFTLYKTLQIRLNEKGEETGKILNKSYNEKIIETTDYKLIGKITTSIPKEILPFNKYFIQVHQGKYKLEVLDNKFEHLYEITRPFDRIQIKSKFKKKSGKLNMAEKMMLAAEEARGGFDEDINSIVGTYQNYLLVETNTTNKNQVDIDFLDEKFNYYSKLEIKSKNKLNSIYTDENSLIVTMKNDEIGPFVEIYKIEKN